MTPDYRPAFIAAALVCVPLGAHGETRHTEPQPSVDALFAQWSSATPGCAVGVARDGSIVLERAYGMADLERDVPNAPATIFEAGSVAKQFTAAAVLLLARDGRLSLEDPAGKHVPELPEHARAITVRQMLEHTSGLRDWGVLQDIAGWPRGTRVYTHAHVLDILNRQRQLNFAPGTRWSYSNSGYNLAAIIVTRVSGESFAEFTRKHIFEPLGMRRTSWRDDHTRVVKGRAVAYAAVDGGYRIDMPFENVHGNGGLLTTVGDLLRWTANFTAPRVGDAAFIEALQTEGTLSNGRPHGYAKGLVVGHYRQFMEVRHTGTTASYRAFLARYPEQNLSIAILCNDGNTTPRQTGHAVADLYLGASAPAATPAAVPLTTDELEALAGLYRDPERGDVVRITRDGCRLRLDEGTALVALSSRRFTDGEDLTIVFDDNAGATIDDGAGMPIVLERATVAHPTAAELQTLAGAYTSDEVETTLTVRTRDGHLEILRRPDSVFPLNPLYADAFENDDLGTIVFRRDAADRAIAFSVVQDRVWDLRFVREAATVTP